MPDKMKRPRSSSVDPTESSAPAAVEAGFELTQAPAAAQGEQAAPPGPLGLASRSLAAERTKRQAALYKKYAATLASVLRSVNPPQAHTYGPLLDAWAAATPASGFGTHMAMLASLVRAIDPAEASHYGPSFDAWAAGYREGTDPVHHYDAFVVLTGSLVPTGAKAYQPAIRTWHRAWAAEAFADEVVAQVKQVLATT